MTETIAGKHGPGVEQGAGLAALEARLKQDLAWLELPQSLGSHRAASTGSGSSTSSWSAPAWPASSPQEY